jgi:hypothetical protein
MLRFVALCFSTATAVVTRHVQVPVADNRNSVKIEYRGPSKLEKEEIAKIINAWTFWGSDDDAPFLDFLADDACNLVLGKLNIKGIKPKKGWRFWCGRSKYEKLAHKWTKDSEQKVGQEIGDLTPPPVVVVGNMVVFEETWEGGPDINGGNPVKENVVMTLNAKHQVTNIIYGLNSLQVPGDSAAEAACNVQEQEDADFDIKAFGKTTLSMDEVKKIIHGWTFWGSGESKPFLDFVSDDMCNLVLGPLKISGVEFHTDVTSWCGRTKYEALAKTWVAASESEGSDLGDVSPPPVTVIGNMVVFKEDWRGGPLVNEGQPVREEVVMIVDPATHSVTNVIYGVDLSSIAQ